MFARVHAHGAAKDCSLAEGSGSRGIAPAASKAGKNESIAL
jgi:hypothetical protein